MPVSPPRVSATPEALAVIERLRAAHGPLQFFVSGGCCDGTSAICLLESDLMPGSRDVVLGEVGLSPVYIDLAQDERWKRPSFVIDVRPGAAEGFSLEALEDVHFAVRNLSCPASCPGPAAVTR